MVTALIEFIQGARQLMRCMEGEGSDSGRRIVLTSSTVNGFKAYINHLTHCVAEAKIRGGNWRRLKITQTWVQIQIC